MQPLNPSPIPRSPIERIARPKSQHHKLAYYLFRFWIIGIPLALIGLGIGLFFSKDYQPLYQANSLIALERSVVEDGPSDFLQEQTILRSEAVILRSRRLIDSVVDLLELDETLSVLPGDDVAQPQTSRTRRAADFVENALTIYEQVDSGTIRVEAVTPDANLSVDIANSATDLFIQARGNRRQEWLDREKSDLEEQVKIIRQQLETAEEELFAEIEGIDPVIGGLPRSALQQNLVSAENRTQRLQAEADRLRTINPVSLAATDPELAMLRLERGRLQDEYDRLGQDLGPLHPRMVTLKDQIDNLSAQFDSGISERRAAAQTAVDGARAEEADLRAQLQEAEDQLRQSAQVEFATSSLKRDVDLLDVQLKRAVDNLAAFQTQSSSEPLFTVRERAIVPHTPIMAWETHFPTLGFILGGLLGFALFALQDQLRDRISHPRDVTEKLGKNLVGVVPKEKGRDRIASAHFDPQAPIAEAAASIVARLIKKKPKDSAMVVHITSTRSGEGKSTLALALARAFASTGDALASTLQQEKANETSSDGASDGFSKPFSGYRTLIMDADMRRPSFMVDKNSGIGLETVLKKPSLLSKAIRPTSNEALFLLPCNSVAENPAGLLSGENLPKLIDLLKTVLDVIVIDGPPTLGLADAALIGQASNFSVYVVEQNGLRRDHVQASIDRLEESGCTIGGVILTKFELAAFGQSDMYRYTYGNESYAYGDDKKKGLFGRFKRIERSIHLE